MKNDTVKIWCQFDKNKRFLLEHNFENPKKYCFDILYLYNHILISFMKKSQVSNFHKAIRQKMQKKSLSIERVGKKNIKILIFNHPNAAVALEKQNHCFWVTWMFEGNGAVIYVCFQQKENSKDLSKMKSLRDVLMDPARRLPITTLLKCEDVLQSWLDKPSQVGWSPTLHIFDRLLLGQICFEILPIREIRRLRTTGLQHVAPSCFYSSYSIVVVQAIGYVLFHSFSFRLPRQRDQTNICASRFLTQSLPTSTLPWWIIRWNEHSVKHCGL